jgi:kumamolisin
LNTITTNPTICFDVTQGNNGGYKAGPGRDNVSGLGVVDFGKLLTVLQSGAQIPTPGGGTPPPPPPKPVSADRAFLENLTAQLTAYLKTAP